MKLLNVNMPVITAKGLSTDEYLELRGFAYGCGDAPPDGGFSFLVSKSYLEEWAKDIESDSTPPKYLLSILKQLKERYGDRDVFALVLCEGKDELNKVSFI